jgi:hypothetical protein
MPTNRRCRVKAGLLAAFAACCVILLVPALHADDAARWYKGNTHAHSLWSDGGDFPEMVADWYKIHGYDFLAITDHDWLMTGDRWKTIDQGKDAVPAAVVEKCRRRFGDEWLAFRTKKDKRQVRLKTFDEVRAKLVEPGFLLIQSEEISAKFKKCHVHINAINFDEAIKPEKGTSVADTLSKNLDAVEQQSRRLNRPILAQVNHPNWSDYDISPEELAQASAARFFEVCNAGPDGHHCGDATHPSIEELWDVANTIRIAKMKAAPLFGIGADDAHDYHELSPRLANPGRAWIMVRAKRLDADSLIDAMNRGDFYASTGVILSEIACDLKKRAITVKVKPEPNVRYTIEFIGTLAGVASVATPADKGDKSKRPGRTYSPEIGKLLACVEGDSATYQFTGKELYVRAVVRSDKPMSNAPDGGTQMQEAWCQPMGWR